MADSTCDPSRLDSRRSRPPRTEAETIAPPPSGLLAFLRLSHAAGWIAAVFVASCRPAPEPAAPDPKQELRFEEWPRLVPPGYAGIDVREHLPPRFLDLTIVRDEMEYVPDAGVTIRTLQWKREADSLYLVCGVASGDREALLQQFLAQVLRHRPKEPLQVQTGAEVRISSSDPQRFLAVTRCNVFFLLAQPGGPVVDIEEVEGRLTDALRNRPPLSEAERLRPKILDCRPNRDPERVPEGSGITFTLKMEPRPGDETRIVYAGWHCLETGIGYALRLPRTAVHLGMQAGRTGSFHVILWTSEGNQLPAVLKKEFTVRPRPSPGGTAPE